MSDANADFAIALNKAFDKIGKSNGTKPPEGINDPSTLAAYNFMVSQFAKSYWERRHEADKKEAAQLGVLGDPDKLLPGATLVTYQDSQVNVTCKINQAISLLDKTALGNELNKRFGSSVAQEILAAATKAGTPAKRYTVTLNP